MPCVRPSAPPVKRPSSPHLPLPCPQPSVCCSTLLLPPPLPRPVLPLLLPLPLAPYDARPGPRGGSQDSPLPDSLPSTPPGPLPPTVSRTACVSTCPQSGRPLPAVPRHRPRPPTPLRPRPPVPLAAPVLPAAPVLLAVITTEGAERELCSPSPEAPREAGAGIAKGRGLLTLRSWARWLR